MIILIILQCGRYLVTPHLRQSPLPKSVWYVLDCLLISAPRKSVVYSARSCWPAPSSLWMVLTAALSLALTLKEHGQGEKRLCYSQTLSHVRFLCTKMAWTCGACLRCNWNSWWILFLYFLLTDNTIGWIEYLSYCFYLRPLVYPIDLTKGSCTASTQNGPCTNALINNYADWTTQGQGVGSWIRVVFPDPLRVAKVLVENRAQLREFIWFVFSIILYVFALDACWSIQVVELQIFT